MLSLTIIRRNGVNCDPFYEQKELNQIINILSSEIIGKTAR